MLESPVRAAGRRLYPAIGRRLLRRLGSGSIAASASKDSGEQSDDGS
jgi:hypothetical protein